MPLLEDSSMQLLIRSLDVNAYRIGLIASNMANIDTPGYRTKDISFSAEMNRASSLFEPASDTPATHTLNDLPLRPDGNNVSLDRESLLMAQTQLRYNTGIALLHSTFKSIQSAISEGSSGS